MKSFTLLCIGASIGIAATFFIMSDQCAYHVSNACNERDRYIDSLAKCNGITARVNKDSTYYIKQK